MSLTRQIVFGIKSETITVYGQPDKHVGQTLSWAQVQDRNSDEQVFTCGYAPRSKEAMGIFQEAMFLGTKNVGSMLRTFVSGKALDGEETITAEAISNRIDPTLQGGSTDAKMLATVEFVGANPIRLGVDVQVAFDVEDPTSDPVSWDQLVTSGGKAKATIRNGLAKWMHMRLVDSTSTVGRVVLNAWKLHFYELAGTEDGDG